MIDNDQLNAIRERWAIDRSSSLAMRFAQADIRALLEEVDNLESDKEYLFSVSAKRERRIEELEAALSKIANANVHNPNEFRNYEQGFRTAQRAAKRIAQRALESEGG